MARIIFEPDVIYAVRYDTGAIGYAVTPDGIGAYWYDSLPEAKEAHGDDLPVIHMNESTFEHLRNER